MAPTRRPGARTPKAPGAARRAALAGRALLAASLTLGGFLRWKAAGQPQGVRAFWTGDWEYYALGVEQARSGAYREFPEWGLTAYRLPLYPTLVTVAHWARPGPRAVRRLQAALDTAAIYAVYLLGGAAAGPLGAGAAAALYAFAGLPIAQVPALMLECLLGFLVLAIALAAVAWAREPASLARAAAAGLCTGMALACRSTLFAFPPLFAAWLMISAGARRSAKAAALFLLLSYAPLGPWIARNAAVFHAFIPFENGGGIGGLWEASLGMLRVRSYPELMASRQYGDILAASQAREETRRAPPVFRMALENVLRRPALYALSTVRRFPVLWEEQLPWILLALGLWFARPLSAELGALVLLALYFNIHLLMAVLPRFARPAFGLWCALAAAGGLAVLRRARVLPLPEGGGPAKAEPRGFLAAASAFACGLYAVWLGLASVESARRASLAGDSRAACAGAAEERAALKRLSDTGIERAARGLDAEAERAFDRVLRRAPCFEEALVSRAVVREQRGEGDAALRDYLATTALLESGKPGASAAATETVGQF